MESLLRDLRQAFRSFVRAPGFTVVIVVTLALGIGANTAIFTLVDAVVLRPLPVENPEQLYVFGARASMTLITSTGIPNRDTNFFSYPLYQDFREHTQVFSGLAAMSSYPVNVYLTPDAPSRGARLESADAYPVSGDFFEVLGVRAMLGRTLTPEDNRVPGGHPVVVLSHAFWAQTLGLDPDVVGRTLHMNGAEYTVVGVTQPDFSGVRPGLTTDMWVPLMMQAPLERSPSVLADRNSFWLRIIGRLEPGTTAQQAEARTNDLFHRLVIEEAGSDVTEETRARIEELTTELFPFAGGVPSLKRRYSQPLRTLMAVVAGVLLIACANVGNLILARASGRQREMALRIALGAGRGRLVRQMLTESLLLAVVGGAVGLLVARWTIAGLMRLISSGPLPVDVGLDGRVLAFTLGVSLLTALLFGLAPALRASQFDPGPALKSQTAGSGESPRGWSLRKALVVAQVAVSLVLLVGAGLFLRSLQNLRGQEVGFRVPGLLQFGVDPQGGGYAQEQLPALYRELVERLEGSPAVERASLAFPGVMSGGRWRDTLVIDGYTPPTDDDGVFEITAVTPGYFETTGIPTLAGRPLGEQDREGAPLVAVVNESFARHCFGDRSPIGMRFGNNGPGSGRDIEIVGLVKDIKVRDLWLDTPRLAYFPVAQVPTFLDALQVWGAGDPASVIPEVRRILTAVAPDLPVYATRTMREEIDRTLRQERMMGQVTGVFALLALLLASIGLYGVLAYNVDRRTSEIGIRMALGAQRLQVAGMVLRTAMHWVGLGVAIGLLGALAVGRLVSSLLFGLGATDLTTILVATLVLTAVAAFAGYLPALRASRLDPMIALRHE